MRSGPSLVSIRTASGSASPSLAAKVSAACWLGLSPGPSATAIPPCAQELALSARVSLVTRTTGRPSDANRHAVHKPAIPVPTMTGRGEGMTKYTAGQRGGGAGQDGGNQ